MALFSDEDGEPSWSDGVLPRSIKSLHSADRDEGPLYAALSDEGDVYFMEGDIAVERIEGAGIHSDDAIGLGAMDFLTVIDGQLYACGDGAQIYHRTGPDAWTTLSTKNRADQINNMFHSVIRKPGTTDLLVACGFSRTIYREASPEELAELDQMRASSPRAEYRNKLRAYTGKQSPAQGCLYIGNDAGWQSLELPDGNYLHDIAALSGDSFIAVGSAGVIVSGSGPDDLENRSLDGVMEKFKSVCVDGDRILILGETAIQVLNTEFEEAQSILLPDGVGKANRMDVVDGVIWFFGYEGVARYKDATWDIIEIPPWLWEEAEPD
ncbi:MAG: hypothetical protein AAGA28_00825 [Pseudomonadota bacterium]